MSFLKGVKKEIEVPVKIEIPALDKKDKEILLEINPIVRYTRFRRSEARAIQVEIAKISKEVATAFEEGDIAALFNDRVDFFDDLIRDNVHGWRKMPGEDGEVEFSKEVMEEAIEDQYYYKGLMQGLRKALGWGDETAAEGSEAEETKN